jgi:putative transcriptional regulator
MGVIINMTSDVTFKDMFEYLDLQWQAPDADDHLVLRGGPVDSDHCIIFERKDLGEEHQQLNVSDDTTTIKRVSERLSLDDVLMVLGYASWSASQLEQEIARNDWLIAPPSQEILFDLPYSTRWAAAVSQLGVDVSHLSGEIGHG